VGASSLGSGPHVALRMCAVCRARAPKSDLVRFVLGRSPEGERAGLIAEAPRSAQGRSAYVCRRRECISAEGLRFRLERALKAKLTPDDLFELERLTAEAEAEAEAPGQRGVVPRAGSGQGSVQGSDPATAERLAGSGRQQGPRADTPGAHTS